MKLITLDQAFSRWKYGKCINNKPHVCALKFDFAFYCEYLKRLGFKII